MIQTASSNWSTRFSSSQNISPGGPQSRGSPWAPSGRNCTVARASGRGVLCMQGSRFHCQATLSDANLPPSKRKHLLRSLWLCSSACLQRADEASLSCWFVAGCSNHLPQCSSLPSSISIIWENQLNERMPLRNRNLFKFQTRINYLSHKKRGGVVRRSRRAHNP